MNNNSDPLFDKYADMDFSNAKPVSEIPHLIALQAQFSSENVVIEQDILAAFRATGKGWQTRMNNALKEWLREHSNFEHA